MEGLGQRHLLLNGSLPKLATQNRSAGGTPLGRIFCDKAKLTFVRTSIDMANNEHLKRTILGHEAPRLR